MSVLSEKLATLQAAIRNCFKRGKQSEYDMFWDAYQDYGNRTNYANAFGGWTKENFRPKYDIVPISMYMCFFQDQSYPSQNLVIEDLGQYLDDLGIKLDTSKCTKFQYAFGPTLKVKRLPKIDTTSCSSLATQFLFGCTVTTIDELVLKETQSFNNYSFSCPLKHVKFSGVIGRSIYFQLTSLSPESMISAISILKNYTGTESEGKYEIKFSSSCWNALEAYSTSPTGSTWADYVESLGWLT